MIAIEDTPTLSKPSRKFPMPATVKELTVPIAAVIAVCGALLGGVRWIDGSINEVSDQVAALREQLAEVKASRFSASDGVTVWQEIAKIRERMAAMPNEAPPKWLADKINTMDMNQQKILERLSRIEASIEKK